MKYIGSLLLKFISITAILELILLNTTILSFAKILIISAAITALAYLVGDLAVLPNSNNTIAAIADIGFSFIALLALNVILAGSAISFFCALFASIAIGAGEWIFHKFIAGSAVLANR